jgi:uncharacterized repeat protein (TIGR03847 family)
MGIVLIELDPVDRITTDAVGPPGQRVFYLQARSGSDLVTLIAEKQQIQLLAASILEILSRIGKETAEGPGEEEMALEEPLVPEWRAGRLSIGYVEERDLIILEVEEVTDTGEERAPGEAESEPWLGAFDTGLRSSEDPPEEPLVEAPGATEPNRARFWATREQMLSLARHATAVSARGRPRCPLCGNPLEPEGHRCPALNGHGSPAT